MKDSYDRLMESYPSQFLGLGVDKNAGLREYSRVGLELD
jgi:hypothetical protein